METAGAVVTYGSAPGLLIGAAGRDVHLGAFGPVTSGVNDSAYGLIVEGSVSGNGVFDNNAGNGLQIGVAGGTVHIDGGLHVIGSVNAQGYEADSTAIHVGSGASVPEIRNDGSINAAATSTTSTNVTAILLDAGAYSSTINNAGTIASVMTGDLGSAYGIVDKSGSIDHVLNTNAITTSLIPSAVSDTTTGKTVALDLSANTSGVTLIQSANPNSTTTTPIRLCDMPLR